MRGYIRTVFVGKNYGWIFSEEAQQRYRFALTDVRGARPTQLREHMEVTFDTTGTDQDRAWNISLDRAIVTPKRAMLPAVKFDRPDPVPDAIRPARTYSFTPRGKHAHAR